MPHRKSKAQKDYDLFPPLAPYSSGYLGVDDTHQIYWEQSGNPDGVPVVFLHGGPGAGTNPAQRRYFDPDHYRIVLFDQRGAGKSNPHASLENNSTAHLVSDIEKLRTHLSVARWHVFGGSWGSTLALSYAATHPGRCISLTLRGIFLMTAEEISWFMTGMRTIFPEAWEKFSSHIPERERKDLLTAYYKRLTHADPDIVMQAAVNWTLYESACACLIPMDDTITTRDQKAKALSMARIEAHYFIHEDFSGRKSLLKKIDRFRHIPATIVQGRYDIICPIVTADALRAQWPEASYVVIPDAGHSSFEPGILSALVGAMEKVKSLR